MAELAMLGLAVDSSQIDKGAVSLDKLSGAATRAQAAAGGVASSTKNADAAAASLAATSGRVVNAFNNEATAAQKAANAARVHASAMNDNIANANRMSGSMSGLAAQFQDIGVTAAMSMNPLIIGLQQGTQIAGQMEAAIQGGGSAVNVLGDAFKSLFQPLTFISIGLTVLAAAGIQMVDWVSVGETALNGLASAIEVIGPYAVTAAAGLALLYAPAILGGLASVTMGILGMAKAAAVAAVAFAAANPATAFILALVAAVAAANVFRDEIAQIFGRDIVADAKNAVNAIIGFFVGGFNAVRSSWSLLPSAMGDLVYSAANATISGVESMINKVAGLIDAFLAKLPFGVGGGASVGTFELPRIENPYAGAASAASDAAQAGFSSAGEVDYVGKAYEAVGNIASGAAEKIRGLADSFGAVEDSGKKSTSGAERAREQMESRLEQLRYALMTEEEAERASYAQRQIDIEDFRAAKLLADADYYELIERSAEEHNARMAEIERSALDRVFDARMQMYTNVASTLGNVSRVIDSFGDKNLAASKAFGVAQAVINTAVGITEVLRDPTLIGPARWAAVAAVASTGAAQVAAIMSASKGSKGGGGGGAPGSSANSAQPAPPTQAVSISLTGESYSKQSVEDLIRSINEAISDGHKLVVRTV